MLIDCVSACERSGCTHDHSTVREIMLLLVIIFFKTNDNCLDWHKAQDEVIVRLQNSVGGGLVFACEEVSRHI